MYGFLDSHSNPDFEVPAEEQTHRPGASSPNGAGRLDTVGKRQTSQAEGLTLLILKKQWGFDWLLMDDLGTLGLPCLMREALGTFGLRPGQIVYANVIYFGASGCTWSA